MNQVANTKGPVMAETFHDRNTFETAIMMTVENMAPSTMRNQHTGPPSRNTGRAQPTRMPL